MKGLLLVLVLAAAASLQAQAAPPSDASIRELLTLSNSERIIDGMWQQVDQVMKESMTAAVPQGMNAAQRKILDDMAGQMAVVFRDVMKWKDLEPKFIDLYKQTLTQSEVDGMIAFYKTDAGKALIEKMPLIMQRSMTMVTESVQKMSPRLQEIQRETTRKLKEAADK